MCNLLLLKGRRDAREAFLKGEQMAGRKYEPFVKESTSADKENYYAEREVPPSSSSAVPAVTQHKTKQSGSSSNEPDRYIGFANLPNQVYRKSVKRGFDFTLMVVG